MDNPSIEELLRHATNLPAEISLGIQLLSICPTDSLQEEFVGLINKSIDCMANRMEMNAQIHNGQSEDEMNVAITECLFAMGWNASHDTQVGGHCDIVVDYKGKCLWLAEAKKVEGVNNSHLMTGWQQITTRYSTGSAIDREGGLLIYCHAQDSGRVLKAWLDHLEVNHGCQGFEVTQTNSHEFSSEHNHTRTGIAYRVRHRILSLHFDPQDRN